MAKSAQQRLHVSRLREKWYRLLKSIDPDRSLECISFGKIFSRDPIDCGHPNCPLCSHGKVFYPKSARINSRKTEREEYNSFLEEYETATLESSGSEDTKRHNGG